MTEDHQRCPIDGAPLREQVERVNAAPTYVHTDGTTHGGLLEFAEIFEATMANLSKVLAPVVAELNASAQRLTTAVQAIEWPCFPLLKADSDGAKPTTED